MSELADELFGFVVDAKIRAQLSSDLADVHTCMHDHSLKPSIVMIGSLIESILYYYINSIDSIRTKIPGFDKRDVHLNDLLLWARQNEIIDDALYKLAEPIRDYRNLIHPRVQMRAESPLSDNVIQIGYNLLLEIAHRVNAHYNAAESERSKAMVQKIVLATCNRAPTKSDYLVYIPILEKYGKSRGSLIVERSLRAGLRTDE